MLKQELAPRGVGIPVLQGGEDVKLAGAQAAPLHTFNVAATQAEPENTLTVEFAHGLVAQVASAAPCGGRE